MLEPNYCDFEHVASLCVSGEGANTLLSLRLLMLPFLACRFAGCTAVEYPDFWEHFEILKILD